MPKFFGHINLKKILAETNIYAVNNIFSYLLIFSCEQIPCINKINIKIIIQEWIKLLFVLSSIYEKERQISCVLYVRSTPEIWFFRLQTLFFAI
jgi:hypothetical protein